MTIADQDHIDDHVARGCAVGIYTKDECDLHTEVSAARRRKP